MMVAAAALVAAATFFTAAFGQPIPPPDFSTCRLPSMLPAAETPFNCCAPLSPLPPIDFTLHSTYPPLPRLRLRRPAHLLSRQELDRLVRGYQLMRALPPEDPRSFYQQANIHCAYCNEVYLQPGTNVTFQVHGSWLFFSYHRWYLYFHERILAWLLDDDSFALPYWNYDNPEAADIPRMYLEEKELYDKLRERTHLSEESVVVLDTYNETLTTAEEQVAANEQMLRFVMQIWGGTRYGFFGWPLRLGGQFPGMGSVEFSPHNTVHRWVGDRRAVGWRDMGSFYAAARDPIFYAHHANVDRLWDVWKTLPDGRGGVNTDIDEYDYLESGFAFYDESARLVRVRIRDSLNSTALGYTYEPAPNYWLDSPSPPSLGLGLASSAHNYTALCPFFPDPLPSPSCSLSLSPPIAASHHDRDHNLLPFEFCLVVSGIRVLSWHLDARFDVYINLPNATASTTTACAEYAGTFFMLPQFSEETQLATTRLVLPSLSHVLQQLGLSTEEQLLVTLVPKSESVCAISGVSIRRCDAVDGDGEADSSLHINFF